jgi:hypothetical protein
MHVDDLIRLLDMPYKEIGARLGVGENYVKLWATKVRRVGPKHAANLAQLLRTRAEERRAEADAEAARIRAAADELVAGADRLDPPAPGTRIPRHKPKPSPAPGPPASRPEKPARATKVATPAPAAAAGPFVMDASKGSGSIRNQRYPTRAALVEAVRHLLSVDPEGWNISAWEELPDGSRRDVKVPGVVTPPVVKPEPAAPSPPVRRPFTKEDQLGKRGGGGRGRGGNRKESE